MTGQRRVIAQVLSESTDHPDAEELHRRAVKIDDRISMATVYRTVRLLEEAEILERHDFGDGRARFETIEDGGGHHHHLINVRTGEVLEFEDDALEALKQRIAAELGYKIVGDFKWDSISQVASMAPPVPGGVGPMTIAMLVENTVFSAENF